MSNPLPGQSAIPSNLPAHDGAADFDFFIGSWRIDNQKLKQPLSGSSEWESFSAIQHAHKLPAGIGNFDEFLPQSWRPGFVGMSLRIFNPLTGLWSIYWLDNKTGGLDARTGFLLPPVVGKFTDGVGVFEGTDEYHGMPILVRYTWSHIEANSARWEQAFSKDNGESWECNWVMQMSRIDPV